MNRPTFPAAPGIVLRERKDSWTAVWQCRSDIAKAGFEPTTHRLWNGTEPTVDEQSMVSEWCQRLQAEMLAWFAGEGRAPLSDSFYDGTISTLIYCYRNDKDSPYNKNTRHYTRVYYDSLCKRILTDYGHEKVKDLRARQMRRWHEGWTERGVSMAHSLMRMVRMLYGYGMTLQECSECTRMVAVMGELRFAMAKPRDSILTAEMAAAIRAEAHAQGLHSIAMAQAFQFDGMLRQKDIIGEWVPEKEPGPAIVTNGKLKWARGLLWSEIDAGLVLRHVTSKRQKEIELRLSDAPMIAEELAKIERRDFGPVIVSERTGRPWTPNEFRKAWRKVADKVGVPKTVRNMDSRAGAITEATEAGALLEHIKHAATHSDISMTQRYARDAAGKAAGVLQLRAAHRNKSGTSK